MARTNYSYEKRGRELEKQKKQEEKRQKKMAKKDQSEDEGVEAQEQTPPANTESTSD